MQGTLRLIRAGVGAFGILISALTALAAPQSPEAVFGFTPGDDYKLASYEQMERYYRQLAAESDRVELREIGASSLGRPLFLLTISSAENLANKERYREISEKLARANVDPDTAAELANEGKAVVWIDGGLHATELAHGQMTSLLAHRVATEDSAEMQHIRDNVIFLLMPVMNPDGLEIVRKWYESQLDTPFEQTNPPELYHHYVGHDNNRDFFMNNMPESKATAQVLYNEWYPQIVYNQHQSSPGFARIVIPPYSDPVNPIIHPGVTTGLNEIGSAMGNRFALEDMAGAISDVGYSMWWNGGMRTVPYFHNMIGILTETGHDSPSPRLYDPKIFPKMLSLRANSSAVGITVAEDESGIPDPRVLYSYPYEGGESHFSEPVNFMLTGSIAVLRAAADSRLKWLTNIYSMGRDAIADGDSGTRYYVIPADQPHVDEAVNLVNILLEGGIEISRATDAFRAGDDRYAAGAWVISAAQAFRPYLVDLLEKQTYPNTRLDPGGSIKPPYDIAGWTLPMQMGVEVAMIADDIDIQTEAIDAPVKPSPGTVSGNASYGYVLDRTTNSSITAVNQLLAAGDSVSISSEAFRAGRSDFPAGAFVIASGDETAARIDRLATDFGLDFTGLSTAPRTGLRTLSRPRVGLYKAYVPSMDEGWTRWVLESHSFDVVTLHNEDVRTASFDGIDAIIMPHPDGRVYYRNDIEKILSGHPPGSMPAQYTGGVGLEGALALKRFVEAGGTIMSFGDAVEFAISQFGLPVRDVVAGASTRNFSIPGSLLSATVDSSDQLAYGMDGEIAVNFVRGAAFAPLSQAGCVDDLLKPGQCNEIARGGRPLKVFPETAYFDSIVDYADDDLLMSGWAEGTEHIAGKSALARVPLGDGEVLLFGFRPQFRGQPRGTYKLIFNALYDAAAEPPQAL